MGSPLVVSLLYKGLLHEDLEVGPFHSTNSLISSIARTEDSRGTPTLTLQVEPPDLGPVGCFHGEIGLAGDGIELVEPTVPCVLATKDGFHNLSASNGENTEQRIGKLRLLLDTGIGRPSVILTPCVPSQQPCKKTPASGLTASFSKTTL